MKIIIIGAGVSGLATYLQLRKQLPAFSSHTVLIYESQKPQETSDSEPSNFSPTKSEALTDSTRVVGNTIGLTSNRVRLLKYIDAGLYKSFKRRGYVSKTYKFKTARGYNLAVMSTGDRRSSEEFTISCPRYNLWQCLYEIVGGENIQCRKVVKVVLSGVKPLVGFEGGGENDADLIIGADGVRSVVKRALFEEEDEGIYALQYEGFCGVGGFIDVEIPTEITAAQSMVFTFGPTGSFGYCSAAPSSHNVMGWWSNWAVPDIPKGNITDKTECRQQLRQRHGSWHDPVIRSIIDKMNTDRIYPIWTTPELPHWRESGAVLLGDAAHTLQATSGQGACQALEDSVTFCLLLSHYMEMPESLGGVLNSKDITEVVAKGLYEIQNPRVTKIKSQARNLYVTKRTITNILVEYIYYFYIYIWTNFPIIGKLMTGDMFTELHGWDAKEQVQLCLRKKKH